MKKNDLVFFPDGKIGIVIVPPVMKKFVGPVAKLLLCGKINRLLVSHCTWKKELKCWQWHG